MADEENWAPDEYWRVRNTETGVTYRVEQVGPRFTWTMDGGGMMTYLVEQEDGTREEWQEHVSESPMREVFAPWLWDFMLDPRGMGDDTVDDPTCPTYHGPDPLDF